MLTERENEKRKIMAVAFAVHDTQLFLDSHPDNKKAVDLLSRYRQWYAELVNAYEEKYGDYATCVDDVKAKNPWSWTKGPWPWEYSEENV